MNLYAVQSTICVGVDRVADLLFFVLCTGAATRLGMVVARVYKETIGSIPGTKIGTNLFISRSSSQMSRIFPDINFNLNPQIMLYRPGAKTR